MTVTQMPYPTVAQHLQENSIVLVKLIKQKTHQKKKEKKKKDKKTRQMLEVQALKTSLLK